MISIVMPICNAGTSLHACMRSISQQDYTHFEILIVDDHCDRNTQRLIRQWARNDSRIKLLPNRGRGIVDALNTGLHQSRCEFIARMDGDDVMQPDRLSRQLAVFVDNPKLDLVASRVIGFSAQGLNKGYRVYLEWQNRLLSHTQICEHMYVESSLAHPSVMFRRSTVMRLGAYQFGDFPEDYDLWLRMMHSGSLFTKLPQYLLFWRDGENRTSRTDARYQRKKFDTLRASYLCRDLRLPRHRPIWFWGAGRRTRQRVARLIHGGVEPSAWIDIDPKKIGRTIAGKPVFPPSFLLQKWDTHTFSSDGKELKTPSHSAILEDAPKKQSLKPFVLVLVNNHGAKAQIEDYLQKIHYRSQCDYLLFG